MIRQFHKFFNQIFGGFLTFGPTGTHSSPPSSAAAAVVPSSVSLSEPRAGALLLLPLLFGTVLYVDIESESSTRKSRRARFPPTTTVTTQWQIFEISFRFQFHRRFALQSRDGGSGRGDKILTEQNAPAGSGGMPHYNLPTQIFRPSAIPAKHTKHN